MPAITPPSEPLSDGAVTAACQDPEIPRWTHIPAPYIEADANEWLAGRAECWAQGSEANFAVVGATSGELLASVGLVDFEWDDHRAEIGYWVASRARRRGVARRAVCLLCAWVFAELEIVRLEILADARNVASVGVARACGFTDEGVRRKYMVIKDELRDCVSFSLLRDDPAAAALVR